MQVLLFMENERKSLFNNVYEEKQTGHHRPRSYYVISCQTLEKSLI